MSHAFCQEIIRIVIITNDRTADSRRKLGIGCEVHNLGVLCVSCGVEDRQVRFQCVYKMCITIEYKSIENIDDECCSVHIDV